MYCSLLGLRLGRLLEVLGVNTGHCPLRPNHLWSLRSAYQRLIPYFCVKLFSIPSFRGVPWSPVGMSKRKISELSGTRDGGVRVSRQTDFSLRTENLQAQI